MARPSHPSDDAPPDIDVARAPSDAGPSRRFRWQRAWPLALVLGVLGLGYLLGLHRFISLDAVIREHEALQAWVSQNTVLAAAAYVAIYIVAVAASFPGASLLTIAGGFLFGVVAGTILTVLAATAGATCIFLAARTSLGEPLRARAGAFAQKLAKGFEDNAFLYLLSLRLQPVFPFWLINVAPALFSVSVGTYALATAIGIIPGTAAYTLLGDGLGSVIAAQEAANPGCAAAGTCAIEIKALVSPVLIAALIAMSLVALIPVAIKKWRARRDAA